VFGVSPAYMISRYGGDFGPDEYLREAAGLSLSGFSSMQLEAYSPGALAAWNRAADFSRELDGRGVRSRVFVAHYLGDLISRTTGDIHDLIETEYRRLGPILGSMTDVTVLALPLLSTQSGAGSSSDDRILADACRNLGRLCAADGLALAVEVVPGSAVGSYERLYQLCGDDPAVGICLDTGHAHVAGSDLTVLPELWRGRVACLHLCDNNGVHNESLAPGEGTIDWSAFLAALEGAGYEGDYDLEIICLPDERLEKYRGGLEHIRRVTGALPGRRLA
jgi:sugar phosphate isomerase/epimerase